MKRIALIKELKKFGAQLDHQGKEHEIWAVNGHKIAVPRHREVHEITAKVILREARKAAE